LKDAGIKLGTVASDVLGVSGRAMLDALVSRTHDPAVLAELAKGRLRAKLPALREAPAGRFGAHHALLLGELLAHLDYFEEAVEWLSSEVARVIAPFSPLLALLITIPGSASGPLRSSWPRSAPTWASSPRLGTWRVGRGCARATTSRPTSTARARPARAPDGCGSR
jgi:hypothetical protein